MVRGRLVVCWLFLPLAALGCNLFRTSDTENVPGRGPKAFDPYAGPASGAIRLDLEMVNGCAVYATTIPVGRGNANIPYPSDCQPDPSVPPLQLLAGTTYFLNEITLIDYVLEQFKDPGNLSAPTNWMRTQSRFKELDWTGLGITDDKWSTSADAPTIGPFERRVRFGNANWLRKTDDTFLLEVLDADGNGRGSITYSHEDFFAENPIAGHTQLAWEVANVGPPQYPGQIALQPITPPPVGFGQPERITFRTYIRVDLIHSTHPNKTFRIDPGLIGDGAIRLTWSQMPASPFYFPITFMKPEQVAPTCYSTADPSQRVACTYGLQPEVVLSPPQNGRYYEPGETIQLLLSARDGNGNLLHPPDHFQTWNQYQAGQANGLLYINNTHLRILRGRDTMTIWRIVGPLQAMRPIYEPDPANYLRLPDMLDAAFIPPPFVASNTVAGLRNAEPSTTYQVTLPASAKPGTYELLWKVHRQWMGERFTKIVPFQFQVGQVEPTFYPGRVGNCQICHRGVIGLNNVRHGLPVDHVEACKSCHNATDFPFGRKIAIQNIIHGVHMSSPKYPLPKNDCSVCHLTRESALRPSFIVCEACHPQPHGSEYFQMVVTPEIPGSANGFGTVFGNCAQQCHGSTPPTQHVLPSE